jgi:hypothetical protein
VLGECYKQLNSSVGRFGTASLQFATKGIESNTSGDRRYLATDKELRKLDVARDRLAGVIKRDLENAAFENTRVNHVSDLTGACEGLISAAEHLAGH